MGFLPRWRFMTWLILAFNVLMACWLIFGVGGAVNDADCASEATQSARDACEAGTAIGAGVGGILIFVLWALGDVILGVIWLVTRSTKRNCPACGNAVKKGKTTCGKCGHDFRAGAHQGGQQWQNPPPGQGGQQWQNSPPGQGGQQWHQPTQGGQQWQNPPPDQGGQQWQNPPPGQSQR